MNRRQFLSACLSASAVCGCVQEPTPRLRLGTYLWPGYEPIYVGRLRGLLNSAVVHLADYPTPSDLMLSFQNRALDAITVTLDDALRLVSYGVDIKIVAVLGWSRGGDAIIGQPKVEDFAALRGKEVGFEAYTTGAFLLAKALELHGIHSSEVRLRPSRGDRLTSYFGTNVIQGAVTHEPYRSSLLRRGGKVLFDSSALADELVGVLVVRAEALSSQGTALRHVLSVWYAGLAELERAPAAFAAALSARERTTPAHFIESLKLVRFASAETARNLLRKGNPDFQRMVQTTANFMTGHRLIQKGIPDPQRLWTDEFLNRS